MIGELQPHDQFEQNVATLAKSEFGPMLIDVYTAATEVEPALRQVAIKPSDATRKHSFFYAVPAWDETNQSRQHELHVPLASRAETIALLNTQVGDESHTLQLVANRLGVSVESLTPEAAICYALLHELGHVDEYRFFEANPELFGKRKLSGLATLPLPYPYAASELLVAGSATNLWATSEWMWQQLQNRWGVKTLKALADLHQHLYKQLTSELYADNFASTVLDAHPELLRIDRPAT